MVTFASSEHDAHGTAHPQLMGGVTSKGSEWITVCSYDSHKHRGKTDKTNMCPVKKNKVSDNLQTGEGTG